MDEFEIYEKSGILKIVLIIVNRHGTKPKYLALRLDELEHRRIIKNADRYVRIPTT